MSAGLPGLSPWAHLCGGYWFLSQVWQGLEGSSGRVLLPGPDLEPTCEVSAGFMSPGGWAGVASRTQGHLAWGLQCELVLLSGKDGSSG